MLVPPLCPRDEGRDASARTDLPATDRRFLERAIRLGARGWGRVEPNPMVGCVIVRDGETVGEGWHAEYGGPHAERAALADAGGRARGATAYVSLEPCRHYGKTPPCTRALVEAGIRRVVYGASDPGSDAGGGGEELRTAGIRVEGPMLTPREARILNPGFFHAEPGRPWTALKLAVSLDGRISRAEGARTQLTGRDVYACVHRLRAGFDAILVGTRTALVDDPLLTVRGEVTPRSPPRRVVLDAGGRIPEGARILREGDGDVLFYTTPASSGRWRRSIERAGGKVTEVESSPGEGVSLPAVLGSLRASGVGRLLCEGGGQLAGSLFREGLVDRAYLAFAPCLLGPAGVPAFRWGEGGSPLPPGARRGRGGWEWIQRPRRLGTDLWTVLEPAGEG